METTARTSTAGRRWARGLAALALAATGTSLVVGLSPAVAQQDMEAAPAGVSAPTARLIEAQPSNPDDAYIVPLAIGAAVMAWTGVIRTRRQPA